MAIKFEILGNNLVLIDTDTSAVVFDEPAKECSYVSSKLTDESIIEVTFPLLPNKNPSQAFASIIRYSVPLANAINYTSTSFTEDTFREFARFNLATDVADYLSDVALGKRDGRYVQNKFGYNNDVDSATEEVIAAFGGSFDPTTDIITTAQTFTIAYNNTTDGSGTTGATTLLISYLDENFELQDSIHVLGSDGSDVTSFTGLGINRALVLANGGLGYNANNITITATTDGTNQAQITAEGSVTQQLIFHTPIGHTLLTDYLRFKIRKLSGGSSPRVTMRGYSWSRVTLTRYKIYEEGIDTSVSNLIELKPSQKFPIGGREVIYFTGDTNTNNTEISGRFSGVLERVIQ